METSDSEYFESADEDLSSSDYDELEKSKQSIKQNISRKVIEPELCKLKTPEDKENIIRDGTQEGVINVESVQQCMKSQISEGNSGVIFNLPSRKWYNNNFVEGQAEEVANAENVKQSNKVQSIVGDSGINSNLSSRKWYNKDFLEPSQDVISENKSHNDPQAPIETIEVKNASDLKKTLIADTEFKHQILPDSTSKQLNNNSPGNEIINEQKQAEVEDNLWDDDELDWGSEAAKEGSEKTEDCSPISKNEDSGWDDFDAEWESEKTLEPKFEGGVPKSNEAKEKGPKKTNSAKENLWEDDDWEPLEKPEDKPKQNEEQSNWSGWGSWGVSSLINTATQGVSNLTSHVSQGLTSVLESGIGIPDPEELAKINKERDLAKDQGAEEKKHDDSPGFGLDNLVSSMSQLTKFVETTGTKVITGGLDTLEAIGKKTVEVLQEGDPGLKKKRAFLKDLKIDSGKPNLSQILREAKEKAEEENQLIQQKYSEVKRTKNYEALFDDHQGLVHLEALEMLSRLSSIKLNSLNTTLTGNALKDMQETLEQVKELCELPEDDEEEKIALEEGREIVTNAVKEINIPISYDKFFLTCEEADTWIKNINLNFIDDLELHEQAIETLAQLTALAVEQFHKAGEHLLVKEHRSTADEADSLVQITTTLKTLILCQAGKFTDKLSSIENANKDNISEHITNIFFEAANSGRYIQDAFQLLIPVLQVGAV